MTKTEAIKRAGGTKTALAEILGVSRQAVGQWGDALPALQLYRLKERRPHWFRKGKT